MLPFDRLEQYKPINIVGVLTFNRLGDIIAPAVAAVTTTADTPFIISFRRRR